ncbi:MAG TPA: hypothetical protein VIC61_08835 [Gammaproteobacteria bacterium]
MPTGAHAPAGESRLIAGAAIAGFVVYAVILLHAINFGGISSLASDSVNYLLMARHLSPWGDPDPIAALMFAGQDYPPLFGLVLGLADAGNDFGTAHLLTGVFLLAALSLLRRHAAITVGSGAVGLAITAIVAISPGAWMNTLDVLSENLYLALSLGILLRAARKRDASPGALVVTGLLVALLTLTRTVGLAMLVAVAAAGLLRPGNRREKAAAAGIPVAITVGVLLLSHIVLAAGVPDQYVDGFRRIAAGEAPRGAVEFSAYLPSQLAALYEAWLANWLYYWSDATVFSAACVAAIGALGLLGCWRGLRAGRVDALYVCAYLLVILCWPHPGQMTRFVYPVAPLLVVFAFEELRRLSARIPSKRGPILVPLSAALLAVAVLPALVFTWQRYEAGVDMGLNRMTEYYRLPDLRAATLESAVQAQIVADMIRIGTLVPPDAAILYHEPAYVALLAKRRGMRLPATGGAEAFRATGASHVLLTRIDPRHWRPGQNVLAAPAGFQGWTDAIFQSLSTVDGKTVSVLLRIRK